MSSKEKDKVLLNQVHRSSGDRESSKKRDATKSNDKDKLKSEQDQRKLKEDKDSVKYKSQSDEKSKRKAQNIEEENVKKKGDILYSQKIKKEDEQRMNDDYEREQRRRRRKEKEILNKEGDLTLKVEVKERSEKRVKRNKEDEEEDNRRRTTSSKDQSNDKYKMDKESSKKLRSDKEEARSKHIKDKGDYGIKEVKDREEPRTKHRNDKEENDNKERRDKEESRTKHRNDKEENDNKERRDKEESRSKHRKDKEEYGNKERKDKEESRSKHRTVEDEYDNKERRDIEESRSKHRKDKEVSNSRRISKEESRNKQKSEREPDKIEKKNENMRRNSSQKADATGDGRENKTLVKKDTFESVKYEDVEYDEDFDDYNDDDFEEGNSSSTVESSDKIFPLTTFKNKIEPIFEEKVEKIVKSKEGIHSSFINFKLAQKKCSNDLVANKMLSRAFDLSRLIEFDKSHFDIVDIAPVLEHSKYMSMFGRAGCQQCGSQTGDDNMARQSQTDVIERRTLWSQHPPLDDEGCVKVTMDSSFNNHSNFPLSNESNKTALEMLTETEVCSASLVDILELMDRILEEEDSPEVTTKISSTQKGQQLMSLGYNKYCWEDSLCTLATFASGNSCVFASVHQQNTKTEGAKDKNSKSFVSIWRVSSNCREPQKMLSWPSYSTRKTNMTSLTFSPDPSSSHVIGGLESGLIAVWDLREHFSVKDDGGGEPPAYLTGVLDDNIEYSHKGAVIALHTSCTETASSSYQLLSLDTLGNLSIWIVSSLMYSGVWSLASGSLADLNLRPGARTRMSIVATIPVFSGIQNMSCSLTCMTVDPSNSNQIFIGTNDGRIIHHERTSQKSAKERIRHTGRVYGSVRNYETASITQVDFYPFSEPYILAGYDDGSMEIFLIGRVEPLLCFNDKHRNPVIMCRWSRSHPAIFFSLDTKGNLNVWNVLMNMYKPIITQTLHGYIGFELSSDSRWHIKEEKSKNNKARLLIWALGGSIEIHELHPSLVEVELDDCFKTCSLFQSLL